MGAFYVSAGINHFLNPDFYMPLIPPYLPFPEAINVISGIIEIILGTGIFLKQTVRYASYGSVAMLIAFIASHVHFIVIGSCVEGGLCVPDWLGWVRLIVIHPLLITWAWLYRNTGDS